jgi:uncharacterized protein YndB with AHSA1/START domain
MPEILAPAGTGAIERTLDLHASRDRVWRAITEDGELSAWFGGRCRIEMRPGGDGVFEWPEHGESGMRFAVRVEAVEAPERLVWRWARESDTPVDAGPTTTVEWRLEALPAGGTRVHLRETGFERPEGRIENAGGWQWELGDLAAVLAEHPWEAGIRRTWALRSSRERVWAAFTDPAQLAAWWTSSPDLRVAPGVEGWMDWPNEGGRFAIRFEAIEPPSYICWCWVTDAGVSIADATQVLRTEWVLAEREDGGTDLTLLETGFTTDHEFRMNDGGWDRDIIPALRRQLGEEQPAPATAG